MSGLNPQPRPQLTGTSLPLINGSPEVIILGVRINYAKMGYLWGYRPLFVGPVCGFLPGQYHNVLSTLEVKMPPSHKGVGGRGEANWHCRTHPHVGRANWLTNILPPCACADLYTRTAHTSIIIPMPSCGTAHSRHVPHAQPRQPPAPFSSLTWFNPGLNLIHTCSIIILWLHSLSGVIRSLLCKPRAFSPAMIRTPRQIIDIRMWLRGNVYRSSITDVKRRYSVYETLQCEQNGGLKRTRSQ